MEDAYDKDSWLYVDMPTDKTLNAPDRFLRQDLVGGVLWRLSEFQGAGKSIKARACFKSIRVTKRGSRQG